jgi:hypothetical protein
LVCSAPVSQTARYLTFVSALFLFACGSSFPQPTDKLASAEAAARSARELGAERDPKAALHLKLATEQIDQAKRLLGDDNRRADLVLQRANADAELSVMLAKETSARKEADEANAIVQKIKAGK